MLKHAATDIAPTKLSSRNFKLPSPRKIDAEIEDKEDEHEIPQCDLDVRCFS
jgi:hypothetical protein